MENKQFGFIMPVQKETDRVFGASVTPMDIFPTSNWLQWLPKVQLQAKNGIDSQNCTGYGTSNIVATYLRRKYTELNDFSERGIGILAGTRPPGNDPITVIQAWRDHGVIKEATLPFDDTVTFIEKYYSPSPLTASMLVEAQQWHADYDIQYDIVPTDRKSLKEALSHSPLGISVYAWAMDEKGLYYRPNNARDTHWVMCYNINDDGTLNLFDSYDKTRKVLRADFVPQFALRYYVTKKQKTLPIVKRKTFFGFLHNWFPQCV